VERTAVFSTSYLAPVEYYQTMQVMDTVLLEQWEHYQKQSYRNRCRILTANGVLDLSIPVEKTTRVKQLIRDVRISDHSDWQMQHWRALESAYSSSPFFEYYKDDFLPFYSKKWEFLWDFNQEMQQLTMELLDMEIERVLTNEYTLLTDDGVLDLRNIIHPKNEISSPLKPYYQVFETKYGFVPNLSIIDLLFNMGNESQLIIDN
jgi:hypothetical protein